MSFATRVPAALSVLVVLAVFACSSATSPSTGSLEVSVTAPSGVVDTVTVIGPAGYLQKLGVSKTLTGLMPGSYTITAGAVTSSAPVVGVAYGATITGSPAPVAAGHTATASVTVTARTGSGALWIVGGSASGTNVANTAIEYTAAQLGSSGAIRSAVKLDFPVTAGGNINASGVAFDKNGNMWVVNDNSSTVVEYTADQLGASGAPTPAVTLTLPSQSFSYALGFDAQGNLWVGNNLANNIVEFTASQLTSSGTPTPTVTIQEVPATQFGLQEPISLAFDAQGNLWVANNAVSSIVEYSVSQLHTSGSPTPAVTLTSSAVAFPNGIAFDERGNLWVANSAYDGNAIGHGRIVEIPVSALTVSGSPAAVVTFTLTGGQFGPLPTGVAFDASGSLWFANAFDRLIGEFTAAQIAGGGNPAPAITISSPDTVSGVGIAFNPHTTGLPLH